MNKIYKNKAQFLLKVFCLMVVGLYLLAHEGMAQQSTISVSGIINDETGQPLPGATVLVEGSAIGTTTGMDGTFILDVPSPATLIVSFISYKSQNILINESTPLPLTIQMVSDMVSLDEAVVVAVGYGTMRKSDLTGAISSVASDDLRQGVIASTEQVLQGKVAGLAVVQGSGDPASGAVMRLRGGTSIAAGNNPLVVVDGIPGVDINTIQPSEIESIDVLKDASSAAIYGSRGANGVIIITTNRENKGKSIEYSGYVAMSQVARHLDLLSANQWRQYVRDNNVTNAIDYGGNTDWQEELEQTGISQSHTISFNNGGKDSGVRASLTYFENEGVVKTTRLDRLSSSISAYQYGLDGKLKLELGLNANQDEWKPLDYRIFERSYNLSPVIPVTDENGNYTSVGGNIYENPVEIMNNRSVRNVRNRLLSYFKVELELLPGLKSSTNLSYEFNSTKGNTYKPTYAVMEGQTENGYAQKTLGEYVNKQLETYLTYDKSIENHRFNAMAGYSYLNNVYEGFGAQRRGFDTDLFLYNNLAAGQDFRADDNYSYKGEATLISFFGRLNYSYAGRYMLTGTVRRDGSSRFGANNKWGTFPSASFAWRISEESFMDGTRGWLDNLKLRVGYGITGNQEGIGEYKSLEITGAVSTDRYYDGVSDTWKSGFGTVQNANPDLKWEETAQINIGLDFSLLNRINGTVEVYQKKTSDLLYTYPVPTTQYAHPYMLANVGDMTNKGIEFSLTGNVMTRGDFSWDANLNLSSNQQEIDKLSNDQFQTDGVIYSGSLHGLPGMSGMYSQVIKEGYALGTFWGPQNHGLDEDGKFINDEEDSDLGNMQPKLNLGFGMNFTYKNLDASFATYGMFGQKVLNATAMVMNDPSRLPAYNVPDDFLTSGINDDPTYSSYWVEDASFFRLQSVTVGYTLPVKKLGLSNARVYVTGENLFVITGYSGVDPEVSIDGLDAPGIDKFNYYPKPMTVSLGLNLSF
ncbi:SusC/RagA family TonB-linked outer membrane protein [Carboxylicivirga litoralis]|uniref:SusC/RagA family TonB-linked outer membrane protein n=1 Tax=Carboxylicivirga litoralis TaxID=2816963 RepID=UPI0021CB5249|nr:TonB-dependent receptor [Carboxylicivirga sp. A043]